MTSDNSGERVSSNETNDAQCTACKTQNKTVEAEKYCVDCRDYYCSSCLKMHATLPALKGHKLLDKKDGQSGKLLSLPTERCNRHNFKAVDMFCENHDAIGCSTCVAVDHRDCKDVFYIPEFIESKNNVIPEILQRMDNVEKKLKDFYKVFSDERKALNSNKDTEIDTIERLGKNLEKKIQEATEQAIIKVKNRHDTLHSKINRYIDTIKKKLESCEETKHLVLSSVENRPQTFVAAKLHESKIAETESTCLDIEKIKLGKRIHFEPNNNLISNETYSIGHVNIFPHNFVNKGTVNVKLSTDEDVCNIFGSCVLPDDFVVFADYNDKNIKLLSINTLTVGDHYQLHSEPTDVCYIDRGEICVCLPSVTTVKMFRVTDKLLPTYELSLNFYCKGISYLDNRLYITDGTKNIHEVTMEGQILKTISPVPAENECFRYLYYICASKHSNHIFVSDYSSSGKGVICINCEGKILNVKKVQWSWGIAEADGGQIFACEFHSGSIILLNRMGEFVQTIIDKGLSGPMSLCFDFVRTRLYVSNINRDEVKIFEAE